MGPVHQHGWHAAGADRRHTKRQRLEYMSQCVSVCLLTCLRSSSPFLHTCTHTPGLSFSIIRGERRTLSNIFGYGPIHILHARMQRMKPWRGYLRLFHMHAKYRSAMTVCGEDTQERGDNDVCGVSETNYRIDPQPRDYFTQNTMATEPAASPTVPVMAHLKLGAHGRRWHKATPYGILCGGLQNSTGEQSCERKDPVYWTN